MGQTNSTLSHYGEQPDSQAYPITNIVIFDYSHENRSLLSHYSKLGHTANPITGTFLLSPTNSPPVLNKLTNDEVMNYYPETFLRHQAVIDTFQMVKQSRFKIRGTNFWAPQSHTTTVLNHPPNLIPLLTGSRNGETEFDAKVDLLSIALPHSHIAPHHQHKYYTSIQDKPSYFYQTVDPLDLRDVVTRKLGDWADDTRKNANIHGVKLNQEHSQLMAGKLFPLKNIPPSLSTPSLTGLINVSTATIESFNDQVKWTHHDGINAPFQIACFTLHLCSLNVTSSLQIVEIFCDDLTRAIREGDLNFRALGDIMVHIFVDDKNLVPTCEDQPNNITIFGGKPIHAKLQKLKIQEEVEKRPTTRKQALQNQIQQLKLQVQAQNPGQNLTQNQMVTAAMNLVKPLLAQQVPKPATEDQGSESSQGGDFHFDSELLSSEMLLKPFESMGFPMSQVQIHHLPSGPEPPPNGVEMSPPFVTTTDQGMVEAMTIQSQLDVMNRTLWPEIIKAYLRTQSRKVTSQTIAGIGIGGSVLQPWMSYGLHNPSNHAEQIRRSFIPPAARTETIFNSNHSFYAAPSADYYYNPATVAAALLSMGRSNASTVLTHPDKTVVKFAKQIISQNQSFLIELQNYNRQQQDGHESITNETDVDIPSLLIDPSKLKSDLKLLATFINALPIGDIPFLIPGGSGCNDHPFSYHHDCSSAIFCRDHYETTKFPQLPPKPHTTSSQTNTVQNNVDEGSDGDVKTVLYPPLPIRAGGGPQKTHVVEPATTNPESTTTTPTISFEFNAFISNRYLLDLGKQTVELRYQQHHPQLSRDQRIKPISSFDPLTSLTRMNIIKTDRSDIDLTPYMVDNDESYDGKTREELENLFLGPDPNDQWKINPPFQTAVTTLFPRSETITPQIDYSLTEFESELVTSSSWATTPTTLATSTINYRYRNDNSLYLPRTLINWKCLYEISPAYAKNYHDECNGLDSPSPLSSRPLRYLYGVHLLEYNPLFSAMDHTQNRKTTTRNGTNSTTTFPPSLHHISFKIPTIIPYFPLDVDASSTSTHYDKYGNGDTIHKVAPEWQTFNTTNKSPPFEPYHLPSIVCETDESHCNGHLFCPMHVIFVVPDPQHEKESRDFIQARMLLEQTLTTAKILPSSSTSTPLSTKELYIALKTQYPPDSPEAIAISTWRRELDTQCKEQLKVMWCDTYLVPPQRIDRLWHFHIIPHDQLESLMVQIQAAAVVDRLKLYARTVPE